MDDILNKDERFRYMLLDGYDDESAVAAFIKAIDDDPGDPDFML